ncbi:CapA family protein [Aquabacterium sp. A7-Y]|uniref:CapA family protein n=1 Tax=Aquabacterium sp. A7-Y TaxID=1349605 RepID=UPI00223D057B|nr:CapA family protein [Aquabacterium sp. A7-Y]MCW7541546.1 CapA family protein [Aquabacterium sp. A7-Y]
MLAGDVMTGRGIDQVMPEPVSPELYEPWVLDARGYVRLAERANGPIAAPMRPQDPWGDALAEIEGLAPDLRIVNLETAITVSGTPWAGKRIHYRMNPAHIACLSAAGIDACALANNHVLDWSAEGLKDTLQTLQAAGIASAGAGLDALQARAPAVLPLPHGERLLMFAFATPSSGVAPEWEATAERPGIALLPQLNESDAQGVRACVERHRRRNDRVLVSLHWGENWVEDLPELHRGFAHRLIDLGAADVVHGHSSHHPLPIEVHAGKLILYGCGDLINDYEGIAPRGRLRSDVGCLYAATLSGADGRVQGLEILPFELRRFRLRQPTAETLQWLHQLLAPGCRALGTRLETASQTRWRLLWR